MLLEVDNDFDEPMPQWRLYFPYGPFQNEGRTLWIRESYAPTPGGEEEENGELPSEQAE